MNRELIINKQLAFFFINELKDIPKQAVLKSLLGHVASAIPSQIPSSTLSKQNCFVQLAQGFASNVGISKTVEFEPQKHLQNIFISAASVIEMNNDINTNNILYKKKRKGFNYRKKKNRAVF